jgi:hypothetical protein
MSQKKEESILTAADACDETGRNFFCTLLSCFSVLLGTHFGKN